MASVENLLKTKDAAKYLGVHHETMKVYRDVGYHGKKLRAIKVGGRYWYDPADLDAWMTPTATPATKRPARNTDSHRRAKEFLKEMGYG